MTQAAERSLLEGHVSILAALEAGSRDVSAIYVREDRRDANLRSLMRLAQEAAVPVERVPAEVIDGMAQGSSHGGVVAQAGPRHYTTLDALLVPGQPAFIVMLDGIEDPFNFGYAVRALYATGVHGLVLRPRNWLHAAGTVARASAGASERIPTALVDSAQEAAAFFRARGLAIGCAMKEGAEPVDQVDLSQPLFLLVGGEKRGITRSFVEQADLRLQVPYARPFQPSLGTTSAAAILGYEVMRQRRSNGLR